MGFRTVAIARGSDKESLARKLGAHHYIDSQRQDVAAELLKAGGAKAIIATVTNADAMTAALAGLGVCGKFLILGAPHEALKVAVMPSDRRAPLAQGWYSGTAIDSQDTLNFSKLVDVMAMTECVSARASSGSIRAHDERQGALSRCAYNRKIACV